MSQGALKRLNAAESLRTAKAIGIYLQGELLRRSPFCGFQENQF
jgi:hypothetical protein